MDSLESHKSRLLFIFMKTYEVLPSSLRYLIKKHFCFAAITKRSELPNSTSNCHERWLYKCKKIRCFSIWGFILKLNIFRKNMIHLSFVMKISFDLKFSFLFLNTFYIFLIWYEIIWNKTINATFIGWVLGVTYPNTVLLKCNVFASMLHFFLTLWTVQWCDIKLSLTFWYVIPI